MPGSACPTFSGLTDRLLLLSGVVGRPRPNPLVTYNVGYVGVSAPYPPTNGLYGNYRRKCVIEVGGTRVGDCGWPPTATTGAIVSYDAVGGLPVIDLTAVKVSPEAATVGLKFYAYTYASYGSNFDFGGAVKHCPGFTPYRYDQNGTLPADNSLSGYGKGVGINATSGFIPYNANASLDPETVPGALVIYLLLDLNTRKWAHQTINPITYNKIYGAY